MKDIRYLSIILLLLSPISSLTAQTFTVTANISPLNSGTVTGDGIYLSGNSAFLEASPAEGFSFSNWSGDTSSTNNPISLLVNSDKNVTANFLLNSYSISTSINPNGSGTITGLNPGGSYNHGDLVSITAVPNTGFSFINWTDGSGVLATDVNLTFTAGSDSNITANFELKSYTISTSVSPGGSGTITGLNPGGNYDHGDLVSLTAVPNTGFSFINWTDGSSVLSSDVNLTFTTESDSNITANFELKSYTISTSVSPGGSGTITGLNSGGNYDHGDLVSLTAVPNTGFSFINWTDPSGVLSTDVNLTFTAEDDSNITANFSLNNYLITTVSSPNEGGTTSGGGAFDHGDLVELIATPAVGYNFVNWTEDVNVVSADSAFSFNAEGSRTLVANFVIKQYDVALSILPASSGVVTGNDTYDHGSTVNVVATPAVGWKFDDWKENNLVVSTDSVFTFIIVDDRNLVANFSKKIYTITTSSDPEEGGTTSGEGEFEHGAAINVVATSNLGWQFVNWKEGEQIVSTDSSFLFLAEKNRDLIATFVKKTYIITTSASPVDAGETFGDSIYTHGDQVTVSAIALSDSGWDFVNWTENGIPVSSSAIYSFTALKLKNLVANFELRTYTVELFVNPSGSGTVSGNGTYTHGDLVTLSATEGPGWNFANWIENDINISSEKTFTFKITSNRSITGNFANILYTVLGFPQPLEAGIVTGTGTFFFGQTATIIAAANFGWDFVNWKENDIEVSNNAIYDFQVNNNRNLTANFTKTNFIISCEVNPEGAGICSGQGASNLGDIITVSAAAHSGWKFINWTEGSTILSTSENYTFTVERNIDLVANFDLISDIEKLDDLEIIPSEFYLSNAYPNPFNPETNIRFGLPEVSEVNIAIFDVSGRLVRKLIDNVTLPAGNYLSKFNAIDITSGIYFYRIYAQSINSDRNLRKVGKLVLLK